RGGGILHVGRTTPRPSSPRRSSTEIDRVAGNGRRRYTPARRMTGGDKMPIRTGAEYLEGLRDSREVWFEGERVADVTTHPILGRVARTIAELYDLQCDPTARDELTYSSPTTGQPVGLSFIQPRSVDDLVRRRVMFKRWADTSGG